MSAMSINQFARKPTVPAAPECLAGLMVGPATQLQVADGRMVGLGRFRITPEAAANVVGLNYRNRRDHRVAFYARQMAAGLWKLTPQMIVFFENGERADGDHRLHAVMESGQPQEFLVTWGWSTDIAGVLDVGLPRAPIDYLRATLGVQWSNTEVGAVRILAAGGVPDNNDRNVPNDMLADWVMVLQPAVDFVRDSMGTTRAKNGIFRADVIAVLAAAYYRVDRTVLARFTSGLASGMGMENNHEQVAYMLRNELKDKLVGRHDTESRKRCIGQTYNALAKFSARQQCLALRVAGLDDALRLPADVVTQLPKLQAVA